MNRPVAAACAALALLSAACGSRVKDWPDGTLEPSDYYTAGSAPTPTTQRRTTDATAETRDTTTKQAKGSTRVPATVKPAELPAPTPGAYVYDETSGSEKATTTERWAVKDEATSVRLTSTVVEDSEGPEFASTTVATYRVTASKLELVSQRVEYADDSDSDDCTFKPALLVLQLPLTVGEKWKMSGRCDYGGGDELDQELAFEVTGKATDTIGGEKVNTFLVRARFSQDTTDDTTGERTTMTFTDTRHVDPTTLLTVVDEITFEIDGDKTTSHRQLRSLHPA